LLSRGRKHNHLSVPQRIGQNGLLSFEALHRNSEVQEMDLLVRGFRGPQRPLDVPPTQQTQTRPLSCENLHRNSEVQEIGLLVRGSRGPRKPPGVLLASAGTKRCS